VGVGEGTYFNVYEVSCCVNYGGMETGRKDMSMHFCISQLMYSTYSVKINCVVRNYLNGREKLALTKIYCNKRYMYSSVQ
jgi:hypothetical protein